jgi:hypothetical protein
MREALDAGLGHALHIPPPIIPCPLIDKTSFRPAYEAGTDASDGFPIPISALFFFLGCEAYGRCERVVASRRLLDSAWLRCGAATDAGHHVKV